MRLTKMFGLAALAAVAAMAFLGASSASANLNTTLCKVHQEPCQAINKPAEIHMVSTTQPELLTSLVNVICLSSLAKGTVLALGTAPTPQQIHITELIWTGCFTKGSETHNCTVTNLALPLFDLLKTALNVGTATALGARVRVVCSGFIDCTYGGVGSEVGPFEVTGAGGGNKGMFTAKELSVPKEAGGFLCPNTSKWDALYEPLENLYLVG